MNRINVALIGNPNTGKTSVFNALTGLNQKVGNYPGITVEKKQGNCKLPNGDKAHILDLPGTYSLNASSLDEAVVVDLLLNKNAKDFPDVAVVVADVENLKRNLLLFTQIKDLNIPTILAINMSDRMRKKGISLDLPKLEKALNTKIALISVRKNQWLDTLKQLISDYKLLSTEKAFDITSIDTDYFETLKDAFPKKNLYKLWLTASLKMPFGEVTKRQIKELAPKSKTEIKQLQQKEVIKRYQLINSVLKEGQTIDPTQATGIQSRLDRILVHKIWGYVIFFFILLLIFQATYDWASIPMDYIDGAFASLANWFKTTLPSGGLVTDLISEGIIPGIGGVVIFIPQIAFLFFFISVLEESGYMSRVVFLMDRVMRQFGLSGKSVVPLISGTACAIPAIMATRNIESWKERLITILVTPFTTCSARLPVYIIIIALVIPEGTLWGIFSYKALTLLLLYLLGFLAAILSAYVLDRFLKTKRKPFFIVEMPTYKVPLFKNIILTVIEKTKAFVFDAGKIILAISIVLWFLATHGPGENFNNAQSIIENTYNGAQLSPDELDQKIASHKLEYSYIGILGRTIAPVIQPLGYDWKIGIAIVSSFAAREVFVGTLATIYSVGSDQEETIKNRMAAEVNPITGKPLYNFASGISLLLFYAFAMQCMSTLAIVKRETNSWKWPSIQLAAMTVLAYIAALVAYQFLK